MLSISPDPIGKSFFRALAYANGSISISDNSLINERQKGKQKMTWSRGGAHHILQIRASLSSNSWKEDWKQVEQALYKQVA